MNSRRIVFLLIIVLFSLGATTEQTRQYIEKYSGLAVKEMRRTGVPASITLAQGILESDSGLSTLATKGNNHFGIKCHNDWRGRTMRLNDDARQECFRVYRNVEASFQDHSDFLRSNDRYKSLFDLNPTDYKGWARGLRKAGYATDPSYANKLISIIERYGLQLYDQGIVVEVETPLQVETPREVAPAEVKHRYRESVKVSLSRPVFEQNGVPFIYAQEGETYRYIASANGLFLYELLGFNDLEYEEELEPGTMVYLARKKARGARGTSKYVVGRDGETLRAISQRFGIRLASLKKMNPALERIALEEGDTVILRKEK